MHIIASALPCYMAVCEGYSSEVTFVPFAYNLCVFCLNIQADDGNDELCDVLS